ncbi:hypothetical protein ACIPYQ_38740 [Streptomyces sp. NPDC090045]|uniref:hypothetical protein n=1 Tax=Streptomyces sp. NPDC090045 TaxID=3365927 RepID=UPI003810D7C4
MADALIEQWRLTVLRVQLDLAERTPLVKADLLSYSDAGTQAHSDWHSSFAPQEFGLLTGPGIPEKLRVPPRLTQEVVQVLSARRDEEFTLWLRLVPPYGHLGAVPWERDLVQLTGRAMVRVPDRLPVATDPGEDWTVAVLVSDDKTWAHVAAGCVRSFLSELTQAVRGNVVAHVFADATIYEHLKADGTVTAHLHDPRKAAATRRERPGRKARQNRGRGTTATPPPYPDRGLSWTDWIAAELAGGPAVRALHVMANASFDDERPLLRVSPDPRRPCTGGNCVYLSGDDLRLLADGIGASVLSLASSPHNPSDLATRMLADGLGLRRSGATLYSYMELDLTGRVLAQAHAALASRGENPAPRHWSLFAYIQPEQVQDLLREEWPDPEQPDQAWLTGRAPIDDSATSLEILPTALALAPGEATQSLYRQASSVPGWMALSERFIESKAADLVQTAAVPGETPAMKQAYDRGTAQALAELRELLDRRVEQS